MSRVEKNNRKQMQITFYTARFQQRECFLSLVRASDFPAKVIRCSEWQHRQNLAPHNCAVNLDESLAKGIPVPGQRGDVSTGYALV